MEKSLSFMEYKDEDFYFMFSESKMQKGETNYITHSHPRHEIMFIGEGCVEYLVENRRHELKKGDVLLVKPGILHFARTIVTSPSNRFCIGFFPEAIPHGSLAKEIFDKGEHFALGENSLFSKLASALLQKLEKSHINAKVFTKNLMDSLILALSEEALGTEEDPKSSDSSLKRIIDYINANLTAIKTMDDIADALFFSKSYLGHLFKNETNMGIMEYVRNKKVVRAHTLILNGEKPTAIYLECGFSNYPSFYRAYTSFFGFSPRMKKGDG